MTENSPYPPSKWEPDSSQIILWKERVGNVTLMTSSQVKPLIFTQFEYEWKKHGEKALHSEKNY